LKLRVVANTCNPSNWEAEVGGSWVEGQPGLHSKILSQKEKKILKDNKNFDNSKNTTRKWNPEKRRKYLQIIYLIRDLSLKYIKNS
jgi:hypothetical protein